MHWHFSLNQVVSGSVAYSLADFRRDLMRQIESSFLNLDGREIQGLFNLNYPLLYWLATDNQFEEFIAGFEQQFRPTPWVRSYLTLIHEKRSADVTMLSAILQRMTLDSIEAGHLPEVARDRTFEQHAKIASTPQATSRAVGSWHTRTCGALSIEESLRSSISQR